VCLATIVSCVVLKRKRLYHTADRFLAGLVGLLSVYQGLRIVQGVGLVKLPSATMLDDAVELIVTAFYLAAVLVLRLSVDDRVAADVQLRLAKAAPQASPLRVEPEASRDAESDRSRLDALARALPRLSDSAFKLYAYLCLHAGAEDGSVVVNRDDIRERVGAFSGNVDACLHELHDAGVCLVTKDANSAEAEIRAQLTNLTSAISEPQTTSHERAV
jgi:hypothetical protein